MSFIILVLAVAIACYIVPTFLLVKDFKTEDKTEFVESPKKKKKPFEPSIEILPFEMPGTEDLEDSVKKVVGVEAEPDIQKRIQLVHQLKNKALTEKDFQALFAFLKSKPEEAGALLAYHSLKNDILVFTIESGRYKESQAALIFDIMDDLDQHEVLREYVLQYVPDFFHKHWKGSGRLTSSDQKIFDRMVATLYGSLEDLRGPIPGTALIALHELSKEYPQISKDKMLAATERLVLDSSSPEASRMAALSIISERKLDGMYKLAQDICLNDNESISLRMSAMHTAFTLNPSKEFIDNVSIIAESKSTDKRLVRAAKANLKNFTQTAQ